MRTSMDAEKRLLQVMLWAVIAAGGIGLFLLRHAGYPGGELLATWVVTAIACMAIVLGMEFLKHPTTRAAGFLFLPAVLVEYWLIIIQVWDLSDVFSRFKVARLAYAIDQTTGLLAITVVIIMGALVARKTSIGPKASWCAIGLTISSFLLIESSLWNGRYSPGVNREVGETNFLFLGLAVLCYAGEGATKRKNWRYFGVAAAIGAWISVTSSVWWWEYPLKWRTLYYGSCAVAVTIAHANLCMFATTSRKQAWINWVSVSAVAIASVLTALVTSAIDAGAQNFLVAHHISIHNVARVSGMIAATSALALCMLSLMNRKYVIERSTHGVEQLELSCPRCRASQLYGQDDAACANCGLRIAVQFEEPRCASCSYLLMGLTGDVCPECGVPFAGAGASKSAPV